MARLREDSTDDELPELADLLRGLSRSGRTLAGRGELASVAQDGRAKGFMKPPIERDMLRKSSVCKEQVKRVSSSKQDLKPSFKNRVAPKPRDDNPIPEQFRGSTRLTASNEKCGPNKSSVSPRKVLASYGTEEKTALEARQPASFGQPQSRALSLKLSSSQEKENLSEDSDDMSDFIVNDSDTEEEYVDCQSSPFSPPRPPPRSTRKLVRGRRPRVEESEDEDGSRTPSKSREEAASITTSIQDEAGISDLGESLAILSFSPSEEKSRKPVLQTYLKTPPQSPEKPKNRLISPTKTPRLPTHHHPRHSGVDDFWKADVINGWIDEYSPIKAISLSPSRPESPTKSSSPTKSPVKKSKAEIAAKKDFQLRKKQLAVDFLAELDSRITDNQIFEMSKSTGGVKIVWSNTLLTTAGRANWKRVARKPATSPAVYDHHATIELATKVIDDEDRLLNVLAHEFCHLANFMISNIKTNPHGAEFQAWGRKCSKMFGQRGVEVTTKHTYEIEYKYIWACLGSPHSDAGGCGTEFKRQSKSLDVKRHACGKCKGRLTQIKPVPRTMKSSDTADAGAEKVNSYQAFVKEWMGLLKRENPTLKHGEIMALVGKRYQASKAEGTAKGKAGLEREVDGIVGGFEDGVGDVVRKLNFMDLTGP